MGWGAGKKLFPILDNVRRVLAIEILCAVQGVEYRGPLQPGTGAARIVGLVRTSIPPLTEDRSTSAEIELVARMIAGGEIKAEAP
jgi:histidine ammonia-lyase